MGLKMTNIECRERDIQEFFFNILLKYTITTNTAQIKLIYSIINKYLDKNNQQFLAAKFSSPKNLVKC